MNKLKAFTVWETLVAMIISGVVVALALNTIPLLSKRNQKIVDFNSHIDGILLLDELLKRDIHSCDIGYFDSDLQLVKGSKTVHYKFNHNNICLEKEESYDTIFTGVYNIEIRRLSPSTNFVKDISLRFQIGNDSVSFLYPINYPKASLYARDY